MILSYCRVSTAEQAADGTTSLAEQDRKNKAIATLRGFDPYAVITFTDAGVSGSMPLGQRPAGTELLAAARKGDIVVANKLDRLFRSASDALSTAERFKKLGIDLILIDMGVEPVTQSGAAKLFFGMLACVAEFERERIAERMADGRAAKRQKGGHTGGDAPFGFRKIGEGKAARLEPDLEEQDVIALARSLRANHKARGSLFKTAKALNFMGVTTRLGKPWTTEQVKRIFRNNRTRKGIEFGAGAN